MEYVYGTAAIDGVTRENLKIVGGGPALEEGEYFTTVREYDDSTITDRCRIERHYDSTEGADGVRYDFYTIAEHYRYIDRTKTLEKRVESGEGMTEQVKHFAKMNLSAAANIPDGEVLKMPDLFKTWAEALEAGEELEADTVLNKDGRMYRVVQAVTPAEHQPPDSEGMLAVYRPIDREHEGTIDDPIPWVNGMDCYSGKYYTYGNLVYLCKADMTPCTWAPGTAGVWQWEAVE